MTEEELREKYPKTMNLKNFFNETDVRFDEIDVPDFKQIEIWPEKADALGGKLVKKILDCVESDGLELKKDVSFMTVEITDLKTVPVVHIRLPKENKEQGIKQRKRENRVKNPTDRRQHLSTLIHRMKNFLEKKEKFHRGYGSNYRMGYRHLLNMVQILEDDVDVDCNNLRKELRNELEKEVEE